MSSSCIAQKVLPLLPMAGYIRVVVVGTQNVPRPFHYVFLHQTLGYCQVAHGLLQIVGEGALPLYVGIGKGASQATVASIEDLPISPISLFPDRPAEVAVLRSFKEEPGRLANILPTVSTAVTPSARSKFVLGQLHFYQDGGAATICSPAPQNYFDGCSRFLGARPFTIDLAEQMPWGYPFKGDPVDS